MPSGKCNRRIGTRKIIGYERELRSIQAQPPRHSESCAGLGRKPSDGEPAKSPEQNYRRVLLRNASALDGGSADRADVFYRAEGNVRLRTYSRLSKEQHCAGR